MGFYFLCFLNNATHFIISVREISSCFCCQEECFQLPVIKPSLSTFTALVFHFRLSLSLCLPSFWCHLWRQRHKRICCLAVLKGSMCTGQWLCCQMSQSSTVCSFTKLCRQNCQGLCKTGPRIKMRTQKKKEQRNVSLIESKDWWSSKILQRLRWSQGGTRKHKTNLNVVYCQL